MRRSSKVFKRFRAAYLDEVSKSDSDKEAYEKAERKYKDETGDRAFKNHESFRVAVYYHRKKRR